VKDTRVFIQITTFFFRGSPDYNITPNTLKDKLKERSELGIKNKLGQAEEPNKKQEVSKKNYAFEDEEHAGRRSIVVHLQSPSSEGTPVFGQIRDADTGWPELSLKPEPAHQQMLH
jgi:hypothetical protein